MSTQTESQLPANIINRRIEDGAHRTEFEEYSRKTPSWKNSGKGTGGVRISIERDGSLYLIVSESAEKSRKETYGTLSDEMTNELLKALVRRAIKNANPVIDEIQQVITENKI